MRIKPWKGAWTSPRGWDCFKRAQKRTLDGFEMLLEEVHHSGADPIAQVGLRHIDSRRPSAFRRRHISCSSRFRGPDVEPDAGARLL